MVNNRSCWSHSLKNYVLMFDLLSEELALPIVDIAAGLSSFNSEMTYQGYKVVSCDPLYATPPEKIEKVTDEIISALTQRVETHPERFHWGDEFSNFSTLLRQQRDIATVFCLDFEKGLKEQRYRTDALPHLSFDDFQFSLALCANFIFDGMGADDPDFQIKAIKELCRVGGEARIYPLLNKSGEISPHLGTVIAALQQAEYGVEIRKVPYEFFKHGDAMLRVFSRSCRL